MGATEANITRAARDLEEPLVRYATRILGDRERARDVVQDAFLKLHQEAQAGSDVADKPRRWLFTVCRNLAFDILRRQKRMCALDTIDDAEGAVAAESFEQRAAGEVIELFERLPATQRRVMQLRFGEDQSYRSIGEATGISTGHVGYLIHDGIRALRRHLGVASILVVLGAGTLVLLAGHDVPVAAPTKDHAPADSMVAAPIESPEPEAPSPAADALAAPELRAATPASTTSASPEASAAPAASAAPVASESPAVRPRASALPPIVLPPSSSGGSRRLEAE